MSDSETKKTLDNGKDVMHDFIELMAKNVDDPCNMAPKQYRELFLDIVKVVKIMEKMTATDPHNKQLFVDGEFDSNQTTFESLSTNLKLGVYAHSNPAGYSLLALLRMIIDKRFDLLALWIEDAELDGPFSLSTIINLLKEQETEYTSIFSSDKKEISVELVGGTIVMTDVELMDIWDIDRISAFIEKKAFTETDLDCCYKEPTKEKSD